MGKFNLSVLDCTLRDGGYCNNWRFGQLKIQSLLSHLDGTGIDILEVGFLDANVPYDKDRTVFPTVGSIGDSLGGCVPRQSGMVAMIEMGHFGARGLIPKAESVLDGIRLIFSKNDIGEAMELARAIKNFGYALYLNPVTLSSYSDAEILALIDTVNGIKPACLSIVDTYGTMFWQDVLHYVNIIDHNLAAGITLGFHSHNNLQMSNANTIEFIRLPLQRDKLVDTSIMGMGRRTGNAYTEVVCSYLDKYRMKDIDIDRILECAYSEIAALCPKQSWGYDLNNLIAAILECSASWVDYYLAKNTLSVYGIRQIIAALPRFERSTNTYFSKELAEKKYLEYVNTQINDGEACEWLKALLSGRKILLLCPGGTLNTERAKIESFIRKNDPVVVTVNFLSESYKAHYCFVSNPKRATQVSVRYAGRPGAPKLLVTSNVMLRGSLRAAAVFNYKPLYDAVGGDNSCLMFLSILKKLRGFSVFVAGFDGYSRPDAYVESALEWNQPLRDRELVSRQIACLNAADGDICVELLTPSDYDLRQR